MMLTVLNCILIFQLVLVAQIPAPGSSFLWSYLQCRNRMSTGSVNTLLISKTSKKSSNVAASLQGRMTRTQLQMGLFHFFHKKNKSNDVTSSTNNNNDSMNTKMDVEEWEQQKLMTESASSQEPGPPSAAYTAPTTASSSSSLLRETIQQRLNRMKSGEMTLEEKEAFLNTALGRISGNKHKPTNTTKIRQSLPLAPKRPPKTIDETTSSSSSISPEDSWSAVVSRKRMEQQQKQQQQQQRYDDNNNHNDESKAFLKIELDGDEAAKQAWLNMVTSPTRFQSYVAVQQQQQQQPENWSAVEDSSIEELPNLSTTKQLQDLTDAKKRLQEQQKMFEQMATKSGESLLNTSPFLPKTTYNSSTKKNTTTTTTTTLLSDEGRQDLASRLEQAAVLQEQRDAEMRAALIQQQKESDQARLEQQRKLYELAKQREEEFQRLEEIRLTKRREEEAQRLAMAQEKKKAEELKRMELERAQDEYWKKKLAQEKAFRESRMTQSKSNDQQNDPTESLTKMTKEMGNIANLKNEMSLLEKVRQ